MAESYVGVYTKKIADDLMNLITNNREMYLAATGDSKKAHQAFKSANMYRNEPLNLKKQDIFCACAKRWCQEYLDNYMKLN